MKNIICIGANQPKRFQMKKYNYICFIYQNIHNPVPYKLTMDKDSILEEIIIDEKETLVNSAYDIFKEYTDEIQSDINENSLKELSWTFVNRLRYPDSHSYSSDQIELVDKMNGTDYASKLKSRFHDIIADWADDNEIPIEELTEEDINQALKKSFEDAF